MSDADRLEQFWNGLEDCRSGLLDLGARAVPMSHNLEPRDGNIWFITAKGTHMAEAAEKDEACRYLVCNDAKGIYAQIDGNLSVSTDKSKLDEVWSAMASLWFEDGKRDPDLLLLQMKPIKAEVWLAADNGLKFLWTAAKAKLTGEEPDLADHYNLTL